MTDAIPKCPKCNGPMAESRSVRGQFFCITPEKDCRIKELESKLAESEAQVKGLTAERDERIKQLHLLLCEVQVNWPCTVYNNLLWGDILRRIDAALKGESQRKEEKS